MSQISGSPAVAAGDRLDRYANKSSPTARKARYDWRSSLWKASTLPRCRKCGKVSRTDDGTVGVRSSNGRAGFAGLVTCGSVWVCPVCSSKILARRALEIGAAVAQANSEGLPVAFCTLTMRHTRDQRLAKLWDGLAKGWGRCTSGKHWVAERDAAGVVGYVRVVETTHGKNGWHVHVHVLIFGHGLVQSGGLDGLMEPMWRRWSAGLQSQGLAAPLPIGSDWQIVGGDLSGTKLGEYLAKGVDAAGSIGMELTQTQSKIARTAHSTESVWKLLEAGPVNGEVGPLKLWREWEKASKGRRQIAWSRGLRERLGLTREELTDDQIAAEALGTEEDTVVYISKLGWGYVVQHPSLIPEILDQAETLDGQAFSTWLWSQGIDHRKA